MIIRIQTRTDDGRFCDVALGEFARVALNRVIEDGRYPNDGWTWLKSCIGRGLIRKAEDSAGNPAEADKWYARYQALRGIP